GGGGVGGGGGGGGWGGGGGGVGGGGGRVGGTGGWAAGLRLAALAAAGHENPERLAAEFSGTERTVAEYLLAEVLDRQGEPVRQLLLRTPTGRPAPAARSRAWVSPARANSPRGGDGAGA